MRTANGNVEVSRTRLSGFDYFVLAGAAMNLLVIVILLGYWLMAG